MQGNHVEEFGQEVDLDRALHAHRRVRSREERRQEHLAFVNRTRGCRGQRGLDGSGGGNREAGRKRGSAADRCSNAADDGEPVRKEVGESGAEHRLHLRVLFWSVLHGRFVHPPRMQGPLWCAGPAVAPTAMHRESTHRSCRVLLRGALDSGLLELRGRLKHDPPSRLGGSWDSDQSGLSGWLTTMSMRSCSTVCRPTAPIPQVHTRISTVLSVELMYGP